MDSDQFDRITKALAAQASRRGAVLGWISSLLGSLISGADAEAARRKRKNKAKDRDGQHKAKDKQRDNRDDTGRHDGRTVSAAKKKHKGKGKQAVKCKGVTVRCGNACVNTKTDRQHCGTCNNACGQGRPCSGGACVCPCAAPLCYLFQWGSVGSGNGEFLIPTGVAVAPDGQTVYVVDSHNHRVQIFDKEGRYQGEWGDRGSGDKQFEEPAGIAVTADTVYVADQGNNRIQVFSRTGVHQGHWGTPGDQNGEFDQPVGVAVAPDGWIYVADLNHHRVQVFDEEWQVQDTWGSKGSGPGELDFPFGVALSPNGQRVYVADSRNDRVQYFDTTGDPKGEWGDPGTGEGKFDDPHGVAVAADGTVYVADTDNNRLQAFAANGGFLGEAGTFGEGDAEFDAAYAVAVGPDTIYVTDLGNARVQAFCRGQAFAGCQNDTDCGGGKVCCDGVCCAAGQVCHQQACCTPEAICAAGFCGPADDACGGQYECPCDQGLTCCDNLCVDTKTDPAHCGGCGDLCSNGGFCCHGTCCASDQVCYQQACCTPNALCAGNYCGPSDDFCGGEVQCVCPQSFTCCNATCADTDADPANCGSCGHGCEPCEACVGGQCVLTCSAEETCCDGVCKARTWVHQTNFGSGGPSASQFNHPSGVAASANGLTVWITDTENNRVSIWTKSGGIWTNQTTFGSGPGSGASQFYTPDGIAISPDERAIWITDLNNHRVSVWTKTGGSWAHQTTFGSGPGSGVSQFNRPTGVAVSADGQTVWVADSENNRISVWTQSGGIWTNQTAFGSGPGSGASQFNWPQGVALAADEQTIWVADWVNDRISVWIKSNGVWANQTTFGNEGSGASQFYGPAGVAVAADGETAWVTEFRNERTSVWTKTGGVWANQTTFGGGGVGEDRFDGPHRVAVSADEQTVWVADFLNHRISVWEFGCPPP